MDLYIVVLAGFGALVLLTAWLPMVLKEAPLSLPIACVAIGAGLFAIPGLPAAAPHPADHPKVVERLTEFVVIISLMGAGLKIDRVVGWRSWGFTWRLLGIAMPLTIAALALLAYWLLGVGAAAALLLAAALAPTDPVLASDIQVGPPAKGEEDETRFTLTSEAGLNDGLAFPFVHAAILIAAAAQTGDAWFGKWLSVYVLWKLAAGLVVGHLVGRALGWLLFKIPNRARLSRTGDGFVALGITCLAYALAEMAYGYGFLAVFVAALALRSAERSHEYHEKLHDFAEELERLLMMVLLVAFGGALTSGGLFRGLTMEGVVFALLALFVVRPISGWVSLIRAGCPNAERATISFYGIRGLGSAYYLAYGIGKGGFPETELLWGTLSFIVLVSICLHGATVSPVMRYIDWRQKRGITRREAVTLGGDLPFDPPEDPREPTARRFGGADTAGTGARIAEARPRAPS
ncbi:MAG TPA: cation:proton antiporter [Salinarimonas sp.]|nr:cation:proton antiporter [Salinarimonas sp.]